METYLPSDFEGGRGHRREFGTYSEDAVEFAVGEGGGDFGGDAGKDSVGGGRLAGSGEGGGFENGMGGFYVNVGV